MIYFILLVSLLLRFGLYRFLEDENPVIVLISSLVIILIGGFFVLFRMARIIENTTEVISKRTKIAGGLLQAMGTAFPDMILGIMAALSSLNALSTDPTLAVNYAIIAAATTFGSNIYNVGFATWCIFRQNQAEKKGSPLLMFPGLKFAGKVTPIKDHAVKPTITEFNNSLSVLNSLTLLTALVAFSMVLFGKVTNPPPGFDGDLYQLVRGMGLLIMAITLFLIFKNRKSTAKASIESDAIESTNTFEKRSSAFIWLQLAIAAIAILFTAETMIAAIERSSSVTGLPFVVAGVAAGFIGCLGEMILVYNFTINPKGRIGDAIIGVGMDNIVTILGATIVAVMGGIFLGGNSLILIFVGIFGINSVLMLQIAKLKDSLPK